MRAETDVYQVRNYFGLCVTHVTRLVLRPQRNRTPQSLQSLKARVWRGVGEVGQFFCG